MAKGLKLNYIEVMDFGGPKPRIPYVAVYLPGQRLLVEHDPILLNSTHLAHVTKVVSGKKAAMREYQRLIQEHKEAESEKIKVSPAFLQWARAVYISRKPPDEAVEILERSRNLDD
jgi:hypothetical protein